MDVMASQIANLAILYSTVYSDVDQRKHQSPASLAFVRRIHRWPVNFPHKWPVTRKMFSFDDVTMITARCYIVRSGCDWRTVYNWFASFCCVMFGVVEEYGQINNEKWNLSWCQLCRHWWPTGCRYDNMWCHQWPQSWHHDDSRFSMHCFEQIWIHNATTTKQTTTKPSA